MASPHGEGPPGAAPGGVVDQESQTLLGRTTTFKAPAQSLQLDRGSLVSKLIGTKNQATNRVSESLDYEPTQNRVFQDRMRAKKEGKKKLYG
jgi:hypothetical protein